MKKDIKFWFGAFVTVGGLSVMMWLAVPASVWGEEGPASGQAAGTAAAVKAPSSSPALAQDGQAPTPVELNGDNMEYKSDEGKFVASGNVILKQGTTVLTCDTLEFYRDKSEAHAEGNVILKSDKGTVWAEKAFYNFAQKKGEFTTARILAYPLFGQAETISKIRDGYYVMSNGYITTSDYDNPEWRVRSRHIEVYPGVKAVARDSTMFVGGSPVMYWPMYTQNLRNDRPHFSIIPGYKKSFGGYVLTAYRTQLTPRIGTTYHLDHRDKQGWAGGVDVEYQPPGMGLGLIKAYYMDDRAATDDPLVTKTRRYDVELRHNWSLGPSTSAVVQVYKLSDSQFLKEFFEKQHRNDPNPPTFFILTHTMLNSSLTLSVDARVNRFDSPVERLPEVNYTLNSQEIGDTGFYFKSSNTASSLVKKDPSPSEVRNSTVRLDTDNEISRPFKAGIFELRPYAGTEQTYYTRTLDNVRNDSIRGAFKTGMDASTKFYKVYDVSFDKWGVEVNKLRHVITPTIAYRYQPAPTMASSTFFPFDEIDARGRANNFGLGLENKLQTKRQGQSVDLLRSLLSSTYRMAGNDSRGSFGDVTLDNEFYPNQYVTFHSDATYDNDNDYLRTVNFDVYLKDLKRWELNFSRRWTRKDDEIFTAQGSYKFNPKWRTVIYERYNARNAQWQEQQYSFVRDLHSWEVEFAYNVKQGDNNAGSEFWFIFRLKAFPSVGFNGGSGFNKRKTGSQSAL